MKKTINLIFSFFLIFIIYLYICLLYSNINITLFCLVLSLLIYLIIKKIIIKENIKKIINNLLKNKKFILIIILISLLLRIIIYITLYDNLGLNKVSDYITCFYDDSVNYAKNLDMNKNYISMFPYLFGYIFVLGNFFKLFGTSYINVIIMNTLFDLLGAFIAYKFTKNISNKTTAIITLFIWLYNPFNILWSFISYPIIVVNSLIMLCIYIFYYLVKNINSIKKTIIYSIIITFLLGFTNSLRPIMIVFIIAIIIYYIYLYIIGHNKLLNLILSSIIIIFGFYTYKSLNIDFVSDAISKKAAQNPTGWAFYVGSNFESKGAWFEDKEFYLLMSDDNADLDEVHKIYFQKGLNNYKNNGLSNIKHFFNKSIVLSTGLPRETIGSLEVMLDSSISFIPSTILKIIMHLFYFLVLFVNLFAIKLKNERIRKNLIFIILLTLGLYSSHLLVEVQSKYFLPIFVPLTIITAVTIGEKLFKLQKE